MAGSELRSEATLLNNEGQFLLGVTEGWHARLGEEVFDLPVERGMVLNALVSLTDRMTTTAELWGLMGSEYEQFIKKHLGQSRGLNRVNIQLNALRETTEIPQLGHHLNRLGKQVTSVALLCSDMRKPEPGLEIIEDPDSYPEKYPYRTNQRILGRHAIEFRRIFDPSIELPPITRQSRRYNRTHPARLTSSRAEPSLAMPDNSFIATICQNLSQREKLAFKIAIGDVGHIKSARNSLVGAVANGAYDIMVLREIIKAGRPIQPAEIAALLQAKLGDATDEESLKAALTKAVKSTGGPGNINVDNFGQQIFFRWVRSKNT